MKTIYFVRHAQSEANLKDILASRQDFALTEKGLLDAKAIATEFKSSAQLDRLFASPLTRARQTADAFAQTFGLEVETEERITEQELGMFAGKTYEELDAEPTYMHDRAKRWEWEPDGGGESYRMIAERLTPFFKELDQLEGESILFVTHAVTMRMIKAILEQTLPAYPHKIAHNGEIWKVKYKGYGEVHSVESIFLGDSKKAVSRA